MLFSSNAFKIPIWHNPAAPPPLKTSPTFCALRTDVHSNNNTSALMTLYIECFGIILAVVKFLSKSKKLKRNPRVYSTCKIFKFYLLFVAMVTMLSGCFDFVEDIKIHDNGSGEAKFKLNLSKSKTKIGGIMLMDSIRGFPVPSKEKIHEKLSEMKSMLSNQPGISNVEITENWSEYIFQLKMNFDHVNKLNVALKKALAKEDRAKKYVYDAYSYSNSTFSRNYVAQDYSEFSEWKTDFATVLEGAKLILIHRFDQPVVSQDNSKYMLSKNSKSVMFRASFLDLKEKKVTLQNTIALK